WWMIVNNTMALKKILELRNDEKNQALLEQKQAVDQFEKIAKKLYNQLMLKENAESTLSSMYEQPEMIIKIREQTLYIEALKNKNDLLQKEVQAARNHMESKQYAVTERHVELKKVEKMIEKREEKAKQEAALIEIKQMDEISLNQFIRAK